MPIDEGTRREYATKAANAHCRCFKCDRIRNDTHEKCGPKPADPGIQSFEGASQGRLYFRIFFIS